MAPVHIPFLGFFLGFFIIAWLGAMMARPLVRISPKPMHLVIGATTAIAAYMLYMTIVGMSGGFHRAFAFTIGAFVLIGLWYINYMMRWDGRQRPRLDWSMWRPPDLPSRILLWLLIIFQASMFINALAPYINLDTETYHYLFVRDWLEYGRVGIFWDRGYAYYPLALEVGVSAAFSRAGEMGPEAANLCFWFMQLLLMGWLLDFCARRGNVRVGYLLVAAVSGLFYWPVIAYSGDVDGAVTLFALAGIFLYFDWLEERKKPIEEKPPPKLKHLTVFWRWQQAGFTQLALSGFFIGTACASKYSALPVIPLVFIHLLWLLAVDKTTRRRTFITALGFLIFMLIPMLPWYGRNLILTGNPIFPFMQGLLGGPEPTFADDVSTWAGWGVPVTFWNYIIYPFKLAFFFKLHPPFAWIRVPYLYMTWLFALAPFASVLLFHRRIARIAAIWCFLFFTFVFFVMNGQTRYFLPFTILALWLVCEWLDSLASARPATELSEGAKIETGRKARWTNWIVFLIVLIPFATQLDLVRNHFIMRAPYLAGALSRPEYEAHVWPSAEVFDRANEVGTEESQICIFSLRTYRLHVPFMLPPESAFSPDLTPAEMLDNLKDVDVGWLLMESRVRKAGILLNWLLDNGGVDHGEMHFTEIEILSAMRDLGVERDLARELMTHRGGRRYKGSDGIWHWKINLDTFRKPHMRGMLKFLAGMQNLLDEGYIRPERVYGEWELYGIN